MSQQQQPQRPPFQDIRDGLNFLWLAVNGYATGILPFIRKDFGTDFFRLNALIALGVMLLFGAMENSDDMLTYMFVWALVVAAQRLDAARAVKKGKIIHSRYVGDSWLAYKLAPKSRRKTVQMLIEPAICLIAGVLIIPYSPGVGKYLIVGCFAVLMFNGMQRAVMEQRVRRMHDAHIEQQATARMFRGQEEDF
ncbi:MAG TPA: hypothetical protein VFC78_22515 [Tepidisphaeraceae bacterium]|nr:hypothetical protein [Tepidisphaeraceae bacterium]